MYAPSPSLNKSRQVPYDTALYNSRYCVHCRSTRNTYGGDSLGGGDRRSARNGLRGGDRLNAQMAPVVVIAAVLVRPTAVMVPLAMV